MNAATSTPPPLRIGVLGAANIARQFIAAIKGSERVHVVTVASRAIEKARAFADETGVAGAHATYESLLVDPNVDAIYNPLPNALHAEWTIRAAQAGKHILCEKPLAVTGAEALAMFEAAKSNGVYLAEAYPYRAQPQIIALKKMIADGHIGALQTMYAAFGFTLTRGPDDVRWKPALAGGARMDGGSYPVSLVRTVAGERPSRVHAFSRMVASGVDSATIGMFEFESGFQAQIACSFGTARHRRAIITGTGGLIESTFNNETQAETPAITLTRGGGAQQTVETLHFAPTSGFRAQTEAFADLVNGGWSRWPGATPQESIDIAFMLDALGQSALEGRAITLSAA